MSKDVRRVGKRIAHTAGREETIMNIREAIQERILFCDGGMGSLLQARGLKPGELPGTWNITHPEVLVEIHRAYLEAGADIVTAGLDVYKDSMKHAYTTQGIGTFTNAWDNTVTE